MSKKVYILSALIVLAGFALFVVGWQYNLRKSNTVAAPLAKQITPDQGGKNDLPKFAGMMQMNGSIVTENSLETTAEGTKATYAFYIDSPIPLNTLLKAYESNFKANKWQVEAPKGNTVIATKDSKSIQINFESKDGRINVTARYNEKK